MELPVPEHVRPLRDRVLDFVERRVYPVEPLLSRGPGDPAALRELRRLQGEAKAAGLWALGHPERLGGGGLPFLDYVYVNEVIGRSEAAMFALGTHTLQDAIMLDQHANPRWRERYLRPLVDGELFSPCFAMTERDVASSDPTQLRTTAELVGDEWVINGRKWFISHAHLAAYTVVMARTERDAPAHDAFSMIIVPAGTPGHRVERAIPVMGETSGDHCEVAFEDVRVPRENLLGPRGGAFRLAQQRLGPGRVFHCMRWLGQAQRAYDLMCRRAVSRVAFGSPLADKQLVQQLVFETAAEIRSVRLLTLDAAARLDRGEQAREEIGMVKVLGARMLHNAVDRAIQVHGSIGLSGDLPLERMYRLARNARVYDGPDETHLTTVARLLLRPYREAS
ncbi:acyl-CoA dehydrogenase [Solihabitans fulvus]|uniref:Acyl-CoA dehydrogenase n=1 Tax=Solihabitans fulvus TaxID=1892852 RepID=A0A5B2XDA1_9PSEU|nr:acyl-CoA dehydrogenase family protein [Solihabitans fulvus]KAA2261196.1 acyl-CoA dehydrogenase [Solihabitans fulvus]